jgi:DNA-binding NarL/FixJ family response regulator
VKRYIKIMLIDGYVLVRYGLRRMLEQEDDMQVVGDYGSAEEALPEIGLLCPDIVLMDLYSAGVDGIEATHYLRGNGLGSDADIIILTESAYRRAEALEDGVTCYLLKDITRAELTKAIRDIYWCKQSVKTAIDLFQGKLSWSLLHLLPSRLINLKVKSWARHLQE